MLTSSMVDCGFKPQTDKPKNYEISIYLFLAKHTTLSCKDRLVGMESGCVREECNTMQHVGLMQNRYHHFIEMNNLSLPRFR